MILFPAIDLLGGRVVRLAQGDYDRVTVYENDPARAAERFRGAGASWIHVVDLDGARGDASPNEAAIRALCSVEGIGIEVGGGVRSLERIEELVSLGVGRIVLGTRLAKDPEFARQAAVEFGEVLVAGVDARDGMVAVQGWCESAGVTAEELVGGLADMGYRHLVYTDISRDGMRCGIDVEAYRRVAEVAGFPVVASGGVATLRDLAAIRAAGDAVFEGAITGRALYEGEFTVEQALDVFEKGAPYAL